MHARHAILLGSLATLLTACGGYGGGNYTPTGPGGATCGGGYNVMCPPPTVSVSAPAANATVSGTVTLTATATASATYNLTVASVAFLVDGASVGTVMSSPYTFMWDSTKVANGSHMITAVATDSANDKATSAAVTVTVQNGAAAAAMGPEQIFPVPTSRASGVARLTANEESGVLSGSVSLSGMNATAVTVHQGFAGSTGEAVLALAPSAGHAGVWTVPANTSLGAAQLAALAQGALYVVATSAAHPAGEIRGQLAPNGVRVSFSELGASPEALAAGLAPAGVAAATLDTRAGTLTVHVNSSGIESATGAEVAGSAGTRLAALTRDANDMGHFSATLAHLAPEAITDFDAGRLSVSVAAAAAPQGAIIGAIGPEPQD